MPEPHFTEADVAAALGGPVTYLGSGTFGDTWRLGDRAVKVIAADDYPPERLRREVAGLQRTHSDYVVALLDTTTVHLGGKERAALHFEFIDGKDLAHHMQAGQWPTPSEAIALLYGLLCALRDLHSTGTVHRDVKPANIALRGQNWDRPVLLDLGLARGMDESTLTVYPAMVGTAVYMAPEQLAGRRARKAADLFAVGVTVRQLIARQHPFYDPGRGYSIEEAIAAISAGPHPLPDGAPPALVTLLDRLTSPREHERGSAVSSLKRLSDAQGESS